MPSTGFRECGGVLGWILVADVVVGWVGRMVADVLIEIYGKIMLVILLDSIFCVPLLLPLLPPTQ